ARQRRLPNDRGPDRQRGPGPRHRARHEERDHPGPSVVREDLLMAPVVDRFCWQNFLQLGNAVLAASSEASGFPVKWIRNQQPSRVWRSKLGWTVTASFNDRLDVRVGAVDYQAVIAAGKYATGGDYAAAIQAALTAAVANGWSVTYSAGTKKLTVAGT